MAPKKRPIKSSEEEVDQSVRRSKRLKVVQKSPTIETKSPVKEKKKVSVKSPINKSVKNVEKVTEDSPQPMRRSKRNQTNEEMVEKTKKSASKSSTKTIKTKRETPAVAKSPQKSPQKSPKKSPQKTLQKTPQKTPLKTAQKTPQKTLQKSSKKSPKKLVTKSVTKTVTKTPKRTKKESVKESPEKEEKKTTARTSRTKTDEPLVTKTTQKEEKKTTTRSLRTKKDDQTIAETTEKQETKEELVKESPEKVEIKSSARTSRNTAKSKLIEEKVDESAKETTMKTSKAKKERKPIVIQVFEIPVDSDEMTEPITQMESQSNAETNEIHEELSEKVLSITQTDDYVLEDIKETDDKSDKSSEKIVSITESDDVLEVIEETDEKSEKSSVKVVSITESDDEKSSDKMVSINESDEEKSSDKMVSINESDDEMEIIEETKVKREKICSSDKKAIVDKEIEVIDEKRVKREKNLSSDIKPIIDNEIEVIDESLVKQEKGQKRKIPLKPTTSVKKVKKTRFEVPDIPQIGGNVYSLGDEIAGELGPRMKLTSNGVKIKANEPSIVTGIEEKVVQVVCGAMHTICLTINGNVITFGCNDDSALGRQTSRIYSNLDENDSNDSFDDSEEIAAATPKLVVELEDIVKVSAGDMHSVALSKEGSVYVWGNLKDDSKKIGLTRDCVIKLDADGKPGDYVETTNPLLLKDLESKIVDIASGCHHILLLTENGEVLSFGEGSKGQLGRIGKEKLQTVLSDRDLFLIPQKVEFDESVVIEKIWSSHWSSFARSVTGDIYVWGLNNFHQLGFKSEKSIELLTTDPNESQSVRELITELKPIKATKMPSNIKMIANGQKHLLTLDTSGQVWACGCSTYGKLGLGEAINSIDLTIDSLQPISRDKFNDEQVSYIACGEFCSFAITESGRLYSWGQGSKQIGTEQWDDLFVATLVKGNAIESTTFFSVSSGSQHTALIGEDITVNGN